MIKAFILAGGEGTRLRPLTLEKPKALLEINGESFLERQIKWLIQNGIKEITILTHYKFEMIDQEINRLTCENTWDQRISVNLIKEETPLGTAAALRTIHDAAQEDTYVILNGDLVTTYPLKEMIESHLEDERWITIAGINVDDASRFGTLEANGSRLLSFKEKEGLKEPGLVNAGMYVISDLSYVSSLVGAKLFSGSMSIERDVFPKLLEMDFPISVNLLQNDCYWVDMGTLETYEQVQKDAPSLGHPWSNSIDNI